VETIAMIWKKAAALGLAIAAACSSTAGSPNGGGGGAAGTSSGDTSTSGAGNGSGSGDDGTAGSASGTNPSSSGTSGGSSSGGSSGLSDDAGMDATTAAADGASGGTATVAGCGATKLLAVPADPSAAGPWPVGVKTAAVTVASGKTIPVEVWYPAAIGSDSGKAAATYNLLSYFPAAEAAKVPASANKLQACDCFRDLPIDTTHGPYPAVIFIHGTGSFRTASLSTMTTWASRGFIAVAADHPGLFLSDALSGGDCPSTGIGQDLGRDVDAEIAALTNKTGDMAFLGTSVDMTRIGMSGHSQGASNAASFGNKPNVQVDMPLADLGGQVVASTSVLKSVLVVGGLSDTVVTFSNDMSAYTGSSAPVKRLVGITNADHLDVTDLCSQTNSAGQTGIQVANQYGVCSGLGLTFLNSLAKCGTLTPAVAGPDIVNYVTTAALEETLHCANRDAAFTDLKSAYPEVGEYDHTP
jgi:predicted dienelactone hydrolase